MSGTGPRIVLDPGHGGGAREGRSTPNRASGVGGIEERHLTLDLAIRMERQLCALGAQVCLTRRDDRNLSLGARAARGTGADTFLSLHFGAARASGPVTCVHGASGARSRALAGRLQQGLAELLGSPGLGVVEGPIAVLDPALHGRGTAAALVEPLVLDGPDAAWIASPDQREALAATLVRALWVQVGHTQPATPTNDARPVAVIVGIDAYSQPISPCRFATRDGRALAAALPRALGLRAGAELFDADASAAAIRAALRQAGRASGGGQVLLCFAGRGAARDGAPALWAADARLLDAAELGAAALEGGAGALLVIADAGLASSPGQGGRSAPEPTPSKFISSNTMIPVRWLTAAAPGEEAYEHAGLGHGAYTAAILPLLATPGLRVSGHGLTTLLRDDMAVLGLALGLDGPARPWCSSHEPVALDGEPLPAPPPAILHFVPLVPQTAEMSCWAAAAAMIVGWRDRQYTEDAGLARHAGVEEAFLRGMRPSDTAELARAQRLQADTALVRTPADLAALLAREGPLWLGEADPDLHVVVVYGLDGDGTPDGARVYVADPWPVGRGERYTISFRRLLENFDAATAQVGRHLQLLHAGGRELGQPEGSSDSEGTRT